MIPRPVCERLNNPQTDPDEILLYSEYEPKNVDITDSMVKKEAKIRSSIYNFFDEDFIDDKEYDENPQYDLMDQFIRAYTCGQILKIYHILTVKYDLPKDIFSELTLKLGFKDKLLMMNACIIYEIAAIILNHYDFDVKAYNLNQINETIDAIKNNIWYKDVCETLTPTETNKLNNIIHVYMPDVNF